MKHTITLYIDIRHFTYLCNTMKHYILFLFALLPFLSFGQCIIEATERGANRYYWDNDIAWLNKYKTGTHHKGRHVLDARLFWHGQEMDYTLPERCQTSVG